jgi:hypothetical protein
MTVKFLLIMCMVLALVNDKGCRSSVETANELAERFPESSAVEQTKLDEVLAKWERNTATCEHFRYEFRSWQYDPDFGPKDTFRMYREGIICIAMPDRWYYRVDKTLKYRAPGKAGEPSAYDAAGESENQEWSYDGQWLSVADFERRQVLRKQISHQPTLAPCVELPWCFLGSTLTIGEPLRWLGRIDSEDLKRRYEMRLRTSTDGDLVILATPKTPSRSVGPMRTTIVLDPELCLPKAGILFENHLRQDGPKTVYQFVDNDARVAEGADFVVPKVEAREGWTVEENPYTASRANNP